jgi:3-oxoacyl-[acyl-carrier-protein] synthase-3
VPRLAIENAGYGRELYGHDLDAAIKVTGVERRRFADAGVTALDLCVKAALSLSGYAGFDYSEFGGLVFVTMTPDFSMPNNASCAHKLLGLPRGAPAFDISMACAGYPYGLWVAGMAANCAGKKVLLLDGDTHSPFVSPYDRSTSLLFGDGGTATVILPPDADAGNVWRFDFVTEGDRDALSAPDSGYRNRVNAGSLEYETFPDGSRRRRIDLKMDGMAVFNAVVRSAPASLSRLMASERSRPEDYDFLLLHQANLMMINSVAKKFGFRDERFPTSIGKYGNIGSGSIALNICSEMRETVEVKRSRVLMSAFGAGFSAASASLELGPCPVAPVAEY